MAHLSVRRSLCWLVACQLVACSSDEGGKSNGSAGAPSSGGNGSAGGNSASGGKAPSGGNGNAGSANPPTGACATPQVRLSQVALDVALIRGGNEGDTAPLPLAIAAIPSGGSRLAWLGTDDKVHVAKLDADDKLVGTPFSFPAHDFQDIAADDAGGVIAVTRDAQGGGTLNCGNEANLCIAPDEPVPCYDMYLLRFDDAGVESWATKLTTASAENPPYTAGGGANHFIWWYQHHARIATDGTNHAVYFCDAITIANGSCVDIHEGDRMQVVGPAGAVVDHPDAFEGGCSHSWNTRIVWDAQSKHFVMVCATDNQNRVARPNPYRTILSTPTIGEMSVGNLVTKPGGGYWVSVSYQGKTRLLSFTEATPDLDVEVASSDFSHLVSYGAGNLLVAWESGAGMKAQVRSAADASVVSSELTIAAADHRYQDFKSYPDGSVAYPARGDDDQTVTIARVLPCAE